MCMPIEWRSLGKFDRSIFTQLNSKVGKKCTGSKAAPKNGAKTDE